MGIGKLLFKSNLGMEQTSIYYHLVYNILTLSNRYSG